MFKFKRNKLNTQTKLGVGTNSIIHPYQNDPSDDRWAVKAIIARDVESAFEYIEDIVLGFRIEHNAILPIRGYCIEPARQSGWNVLIKMPRMNKSLKELIINKKCLLEENILKYFYDLVCGLEYLHNQRQIPHRNIKPSNILFDKYGSIKLADVSKGRMLADADIFSLSQGESVLMYIAPEISSSGFTSKKKEELFKADVWSLGVIIAELCIAGHKTGDLWDMLKSDDEIRKMLSELEENYSRELLSVIRSMLQLDPKKRKSIQKIKEMLEESFKNRFEKPKIENEEEEEEKKENNIGYLREELDRIRQSRPRSRDEARDENLDPNTLLNRVKEFLIKGEFKGVFEFDNNKLFSVKKQNENWVTDKGIKDFMTEMEKKLKEHKLANIITDFEFDLLMCDRITDGGVTSLSVGIGVSLPNLQQLSLNFRGCSEITDQGIRDLGHLGANLSKLHQCQKISNEGVKSLGSTIGNKFKLFCSKITAEGIQDLASKISTNLKDLKEINLKFACCNDVTDAGLKALTSCVGDALPKLQKLALVFTGCRKITSSGVKDFCAHIKAKGLKLKDLSLDFRDLDKLNDSTKQKVRTMLNGIPQLNIMF